ncbi:ATPase, T2SS/T4P/T4SS family [Coxiella-like endosymbiont of Rhipicephalus sanguineus]|nr:ATPase, T2SS/T4P/T4SS family [Coxiella-like endosymbiont of Rhipicephalus sanguineus]
MISKIRDLDTTSIAIRASYTGHLVLATYILTAHPNPLLV